MFRPWIKSNSYVDYTSLYLFFLLSSMYSSDKLPSYNYQKYDPQLLVGLDLAQEDDFDDQVSI